MKTIPQEFSPRRLLPSLVAGLVTGTIAVTIATASGVLIFSGDLSAYIPAGALGENEGLRAKLFLDDVHPPLADIIGLVP